MSSSDVDDAEQRWQNDNDVLKTHTECCCTYIYVKVFQLFHSQVQQ